MLRRFIWITLIAVLAFGLGWSSHFFQKPAPMKWELSDALPDWEIGTCVPENTEERKAYEAAIAILELENNGLFLDIGAKKFLAAGMYRREAKKSDPVCPPQDIYERALNSNSLKKEIKYRLVEYELKFFSRLPAQNANIIQAVEKFAFNEKPQQSELFNSRDIRPYARTVLAGFGKSASGVSSTAYQKMSADDSLGTGAAQISAATGHPDALPRIQALMEDLLSSVPRDKSVPRALRNRLYELAYAIYFSGDAAKGYTAPIRSLMERQVDSWAPPFGMIPLHPKRMCELLKRIEGTG